MKDYKDTKYKHPPKPIHSIPRLNWAVTRQIINYCHCFHTVMPYNWLYSGHSFLIIASCFCFYIFWFVVLLTNLSGRHKEVSRSESGVKSSECLVCFPTFSSRRNLLNYQIKVCRVFQGSGSRVHSKFGQIEILLARRGAFPGCYTF